MTVILSNKVDGTEPWDGFMLRDAEISTSNKVDDTAAWEFMTRVAKSGYDPDLTYWPYPVPGGVLATYRQKCVDTVTGLWTEWVTDYQDIYGEEYPGSGFDAGTYRIANISYDEGQG